jgi:hypothetical protein
MLGVKPHGGARVVAGSLGSEPLVVVFRDMVVRPHNLCNTINKITIVDARKFPVKKYHDADLKCVVVAEGFPGIALGLDVEGHVLEDVEVALVCAGVHTLRALAVVTEPH